MSDIGPYTICPAWVPAAIKELAAKRAANDERAPSPWTLPVYIALGMRSDRGNGECWPSRKTIAVDVGCSVQAVDRALVDLTEIGAVETVTPGGSTERPGSTVRRVIFADPLPPQTTPPLSSERDPLITGEGQNYHQEPAGVKASSEIGTDTPPYGVSPLKNRDGDASFPQTVHNLCRTLADLVTENGYPVPKTQKQKRGWLVAMDRLLRLGPPGFTSDPPPSPAEVTETIVWACRDSDFWVANIRSPAKLRAQYARLRLDMRRDQPKKPAYAALRQGD